MYIPYETLGANSRVWFYQASRALTADEKSQVEAYLQEQISSWVTHGMPMKGSFQILYNRVVLIAADVEFQSPSGCSIDSSTRWFKTLGKMLEIDFFDRSVGYWNNDDLAFINFFQVKKAIESGLITANTLLLNHQKASVSEPLTVKAAESAFKKYFKLAEEAKS